MPCSSWLLWVNPSSSVSSLANSIKSLGYILSRPADLYRVNFINRSLSCFLSEALLTMFVLLCLVLVLRLFLLFSLWKIDLKKQLSGWAISSHPILIPSLYLYFYVTDWLNVSWAPFHRENKSLLLLPGNRVTLLSQVIETCILELEISGPLCAADFPPFLAFTALLGTLAYCAKLAKRWTKIWPLSRDARWEKASYIPCIILSTLRRPGTVWLQRATSSPLLPFLSFPGMFCAPQD